MKNQFGFSDERAIIDRHADINAKYIDKRAYVGAHSNVGKNVNIGELAVIHEYVLLLADVAIKPTEIVVRTQTSLILYQRGARDVSSDEYVFTFFSQF